jgi:hypothetical protein
MSRAIPLITLYAVKVCTGTNCTEEVKGRLLFVFNKVIFMDTIIFGLLINLESISADVFRNL